LSFSWVAFNVQGMSKKAEAILETARSLPPAELRELCRQINRLAAKAGKAGKLTRGKRALAALLRGGKIKGDTGSWLRLTRGAA
jgi:hypothetical protein